MDNDHKARNDVYDPPKSSNHGDGVCLCISVTYLFAEAFSPDAPRITKH